MRFVNYTYQFLLILLLMAIIILPLAFLAVFNSLYYIVYEEDSVAVTVVMDIFIAPLEKLIAEFTDTFYSTPAE